MTKKEAKELCIKKWEWIIEHEGELDNDIYEDIPEIESLKYDCAYCEKYIHTKGQTLIHCQKCPIRPKIKDYNDLEKFGCAQDCHPYALWEDEDYDTDLQVKYAQAVLDLIKKS